MRQIKMHTIKLKHPQDETNQQGWITNYLDSKMDMKDLLFLQSLCLVSSMSTAFHITLFELKYLRLR